MEHRATGALQHLEVQVVWATSRAQLGASGIRTQFAGGNIGFDMGQGLPEAHTSSLLAAADEVFPGTAGAYLPGSATRMHWPTAPHYRGSNACFRPGKASWVPIVGVAQDGVHFCGEHTLTEYQGYMEGACESGERVAQEIVNGGAT